MNGEGAPAPNRVYFPVYLGALSLCLIIFFTYRTTLPLLLESTDVPTFIGYIIVFLWVGLIPVIITDRILTVIYPQHATVNHTLDEYHT